MFASSGRPSRAGRRVAPPAARLGDLAARTAAGAANGLGGLDATGTRPSTRYSPASAPVEARRPSGRQPRRPEPGGASVEVAALPCQPPERPPPSVQVELEASTSVPSSPSPPPLIVGQRPSSARCGTRTVGVAVDAPGQPWRSAVPGPPSIVGRWRLVGHCHLRSISRAIGRPGPAHSVAEALGEPGQRGSTRASPRSPSR